MLEKRLRSWCMIALSVTFSSAACLQAEGWTWSYEDRPNVQDRRSATYIMARGEAEPLPKFKQLIFSWNVALPDAGHYSLFVQLRDAGSRRWSDWHRMIIWGNNVHRSFFSRSQKIDASFCLLRAEMEAGRRADAFRLKIEHSEGNPLSGLVLMHACTSDMTQMVTEVKKKPDEGYVSCRVKGVPLYSQRLLDHPRIGSLCAPTSCSMLAAWAIKESVDPVVFADAVYDVGFNSYGNWSLNMAQLYVSCHKKYRCTAQRLAGFTDLHALLKRGLPVSVSLRGSLSNAAKLYDSGHLVVVVGWDAQRRKVLCHDPAFGRREDVAVAYDLDEFLAAWERSHRLAYVIQR